MTIQQFALVVEQKVDKSVRVALMERCGDIAIDKDPHRDGEGAVIRFSRDAPTLIDAVVSAVRDLDAVGLPAVRVFEDDDIVTLAMIADRVGRSREAVRLWSVGRTGPGGFPGPSVFHIHTAYYRWSEVVPWLRERMGMPVPDSEPVLAAVNLALQLRAMAPRVSRMDAVRALIAA
jgi:hypothetical protein